MIYEIIILLLAIPAGYLIAGLCRDELVQGRKWFMILIIAGLVLGLFFWIYEFSSIALSCVFISIASFISYLKSKDKKWTRKK